MSFVIRDHDQRFAYLLQNSSAALFADDLCLWKVGTDIPHLNKLTQASLNKVEAWCETNGFKISVKKSAAILFTKKHTYITCNLRSSFGTGKTI